VKFVAYLESLTAAGGALWLMPGSHHRDFSAAIDAWDARNPARDAEQLWQQITGLPCYVAETQPGDVIAFNWHIRHASIGGKDRRQWTISYAKDPQTAEEAERLQDFLAASSPTATSPMTTTPTPATTSTGWAPIRRIHSGRPSPSGCVSWTCSGSPTAGDRHAVPALWQSAWQSTSQHQTGLRRSGWIWHLT
jgi:hypothetical protein